MLESALQKIRSIREIRGLYLFAARTHFLPQRGFKKPRIQRI